MKHIKKFNKMNENLIVTSDLEYYNRGEEVSIKQYLPNFYEQTKLNNKWYNDPNFDDGLHLITFDKIPLNSIKLIYKGSFTLDESINIQTDEYNDSDIIIKQEEKTNETYDFIKQYLDVIDFDSYINNHNLYQVVARYDNSIIGIRIFRMNDGKIHLNYSAVIPEFRNKGLNKKMFNEIEKIGILNNVNIITSNVRESNISSLKSLLGSGFQINKNYDLKYPDGEKKLPLFKRL